MNSPTGYVSEAHRAFAEFCPGSIEAGHIPACARLAERLAELDKRCDEYHARKSAVSATPVAREGTTPEELARQVVGQIVNDWAGGTRNYRDSVEWVAAAIRDRDASAVEVERTMREALEVHAFAGADDGNGLNRDECGTCWRRCSWCDERVAEGRLDCKGHDARAALARVASLRGGTGR